MQNQRISWNPSNVGVLINELTKTQNKSAAFKATAQRLGMKPNAVRQYYYKSFIYLAAKPNSKQKNKAWTPQDDECLLRYIRVYGAINLHNCFVAVAEQLGRTPKAVSHHWYNKLSKNPKVKGFIFADCNHVAINRKNGGKAIESNVTIWRRFLKVLHFLGL